MLGSGSAANEPVAGGEEVQASAARGHYPSPSRVGGDHHFHITNRRLLFCRQFPQVEN